MSQSPLQSMSYSNLKRAPQALAWALSCLLAWIPTAAPAQEPACHIESETFVSKHVICTIETQASPRRFEFVASFSGGHDDTRASIETTLNDEALACDESSKKTLFGEDGTVTLYCRFNSGRDVASKARLSVTIRWSHAQFESFGLFKRDM